MYVMCSFFIYIYIYLFLFSSIALYKSLLLKFIPMFIKGTCYPANNVLHFNFILLQLNLNVNVEMTSLFKEKDLRCALCEEIIEKAKKLQCLKKRKTGVNMLLKKN